MLEITKTLTTLKETHEMRIQQIYMEMEKLDSTSIEYAFCEGQINSFKETINFLHITSLLAK